MNFWDFEAWGGINVVAILLLSLLAANMLKKMIRPLQESLIPTSVLGGIMLLIVSSVYAAVTGEGLFDTGFFGGDGYARGGKAGETGRVFNDNFKAVGCVEKVFVELQN